MRIPLFTKSSSPVVTSKQSPQHHRMSLPYILNPSEPVTREEDPVVEPLVPAIPLNSQLNSHSSSPSSSRFEDLIPTSFMPDFSSDLLRYSLSHNTPHGSTDSQVPSHRSNSLSPSPSLSEFERLISASFTPDFSADLLRYSLSYNPRAPHPDLSDFDLPQEHLSGSRASSPLSSEFEDLIPLIPTSDSSHDLVPYSPSFNPEHRITTYHGSRDIFRSGSDMSRGRTESTNLDGDHPIPLPPIRHISNSPPTSAITRWKSPAIDITPFSRKVKCGSPPQHPKMALSYILNPSSSQERIGPEVVTPKSMYPATSLSPSPTVRHELNSSLPDTTPPTSPKLTPNSPLSIHRPISPPSCPSSPPFLSRFERLPPPHFLPDFTFDFLPYSLIYQSGGSNEGSSDNLADLAFRSIRVQCPIRPPSVSPPTNDPDSESRSISPQSSIDPVDTPNPGSESPQEESLVASPITTPPSSPLPTVDTFYLVEPPQLLPWEGPAPPGLSERNHAAYQRAGVHWMLAQIFGGDIG